MYNCIVAWAKLVFNKYRCLLLHHCLFVHRFFAILYPLRLPIARKRSKMMLYLAWIMALLCSLPQVNNMLLLIEDFGLPEQKLSKYTCKVIIHLSEPNQLMSRRARTNRTHQDKRSHWSNRWVSISFSFSLCFVLHVNYKGSLRSFKISITKFLT